MELHTIRGGTKEDLQKRQYNIGIGISLGTKWFSPENIIETIRWALPFSREHVIVYVADTIHAINLAVRNRISYERSQRTTIRHGQEILEKLQTLVRTNFSIEEQEKIIYATWPDITTDAYRAKVEYLYGLYDSNFVFRDCIQNVVRAGISKEERTFKEDEIRTFGTYILEELPELMGRVPIKGIIYEAYAYPFDGELTQLVEKLQKGEIFPEVRDRILDTEPKAFLEVR